MLSAAAKEDEEIDLTFKFAVAATCFLVYDTLIHIADEVNYIWSGQRVWMKVAYVFIRHMPYLAQGSILTLIGASQAGYDWHQLQCRDWIIYQLTINEALTIAVEIVLIMRIYAMFNRNKAIVAIVFLLFVAEVTAMIAVLVVSIPKIEFTNECIITRTPGIFTSYWIFSLVFETILFGLTLVKFFTSMSRHLGRQSIMYTLVRDGTWAYGVIFVIMLLNTLMYHLIKNPLAGLCFFWELAIMSFAGSHVLIGLRRVAVRTSFHRPHEWNSEDLESIQFSPSDTTFSLTRRSGIQVRDPAVFVELQDMRSSGSKGFAEDVERHHDFPAAGEW